MNNLDMLTAREQLMEDIQSIVESTFYQVFPHSKSYLEVQDELIEELCDAVCTNFP